MSSRVAVAAAPALILREGAVAADLVTVRRLVRATGFFSAEEQTIAVELVEERLAKGAASGYEFLFAERGTDALGYACFGRVPLTQASFDLYWIVVRPEAQGSGIGRLLLTATEQAVAAAGGTALYAETSSREQYAPTRGFYRRTGYSVIAEFPDFYAPGDGKVVFVKRLTSNG
jgi:ribosomal protein S18 acetylase RimI-like enzyme